MGGVKIMTNQMLIAWLLCTCAPGLILFATAQTAMAQSGGGNSIETVVVTASRLHAQEVKKNAPNVIEVQPYTEIRKLPDVNIAEALQRIPGISMESDTGEGRFINIRGMDADLNGTTFDGVVMTASNQSSPQSGARAVAFDAFPSQLVGAVEVVKSVTPDMDATGLGGVVNLVPRALPADGSAFVDVGMGSGVEPLRDRPLWQADASAGTSFDMPGHQGSDRFTIVATYAAYEDWRGIDDLEESYFNSPLDLSNPDYSKTLDNVQYRWYEYHRTRQGMGSNLTFAPDANTTLYVRAFWAGYTEHDNKHHLEIHNLGDITGAPFGSDPDANGNYDAPNAQPLQTSTEATEHVGNELLTVGGHSLFGPLKADYRASWTRGYDDFPTNWGIGFALPDSMTSVDGSVGATPLTYNNITSAAFPTYNSALNLANPANYYLGPGESGSQLQNGISKSYEQEWSGALDFSLPLDLIGHDGTLKFGGEARLRQRGVSADQLTYQTLADVNLANYVGGADQVYYDGHYDIGPNLNAKAIEAIPGIYLSDPAGDQQNDLASFEHDDENVYAGYLMYTTDYGPVNLLAGVRYEVTNGAYHANLATTDMLGNTTYTPNVNKQNYGDFFPSLQTKYRLDDDTQFRAAFSTAIARPGFNQITAAKSIDLQSSFPNIIISEGNPSLKPTTGDSFDLDVEHYMPNGGIVTLGAFYKYFSNYIIPTSITTTGTGGIQTTINSFSNIGTAFTEGLEANYEQKLAFLPDPLDGMGIGGNVTEVYARGDIRPGDRSILPQTSRFNYNAELNYDKGPIGIRVAASYVSANIFSVGGDPTTDVYSQPRFRLDLGATYDLSDNIQFYFDAKNLTNTLLEFTQTSSTYYPIQREFYGPTYFFGVRFRTGDAGVDYKAQNGDDD